MYETHSAAVFFFGDRVYKVKKPVDLGCGARPARVAAERIERRAGTGDPSDATVEIATNMRQTFAPWAQATTIDTTGSVQQSVTHAADAVRTDHTNAATTVTSVLGKVDVDGRWAMMGS